MLIPKKFKHRKHFKGKIKGLTSKGHFLKYGLFGLKSLEETRLDANQIEAARKIITRRIKKLGYLWIRVYPDIPVTKKPTENRMGKGKGAFSKWVVKIKPGQVIFEVSGLTFEKAKRTLNTAAKKLPVQCKFIQK